MGGGVWVRIGRGKVGGGVGLGRPNTPCSCLLGWLGWMGFSWKLRRFSWKRLLLSLSRRLPSSQRRWLLWNSGVGPRSWTWTMLLLLFLLKVDSRLDEATDWQSEPPSLLAAVASTGVTLIVVTAWGWGWKGGAKVAVGVNGMFELLEGGLKLAWALLKLGLLELLGLKLRCW